ncbi:hypothetical protein AEA09_09155 [Lysinibacillus contaminans]|uniref:Uncharacterized protein n=1 Tax=Lysinibacillus contaminans TaxID=1293441 RepID=A0ABR5K1C0_9BACI|nr:hypothetical protein [Lysinibacillus contaminans]KOS68691.1 hypothetical protein AEA09_09155 [Lysinibacillus contaminans]
MEVSYEQVRSITIFFSGYIESAKRVELSLPETSLCSRGEGSCCEPKDRGGWMIRELKETNMDKVLQIYSAGWATKYATFVG